MSVMCRPTWGLLPNYDIKGLIYNDAQSLNTVTGHIGLKPSSLSSLFSFSFLSPSFFLFFFFFPFSPFSFLFLLCDRPWATQNQVAVAHVAIAKTPQRPVRLCIQGGIMKLHGVDFLNQCKKLVVWGSFLCSAYRSTRRKLLCKKASEMWQKELLVCVSLLSIVSMQCPQSHSMLHALC